MSLNSPVLPDEIKCQRVTLKALTVNDSEELFELIDRERERLGQWLSWVSSCNSVEDVRSKRHKNISKRREGTLFDYSICLAYDERIIGACGVFNFSNDSLFCEIGYWISGRHEGKGLVSDAVCGLQETCFQHGVKEIQISCVPENKRSAAIPMKLGYQLTKDSETQRIFTLKNEDS